MVIGCDVSRNLEEIMNRRPFLGAVPAAVLLACRLPASGLRIINIRIGRPGF
jgi:hypothetical protein